MRYAIVIKKTGIVDNVIELEEGHDWPIPDGSEVVKTETAGPGWSYKDGKFIPAPENKVV